MNSNDLKTTKKGDYIYSPDIDMFGKTRDYFYKVFSVRKNGLCLSKKFYYGQGPERGKWCTNFKSKYGELDRANWVVIHADSRLAESIESRLEDSNNIEIDGDNISDFDGLDKLLFETASKIKAMILKEIKGFKSFPEIYMGVRDRKNAVKDACIPVGTPCIDSDNIVPILKKGIEVHKEQYQDKGIILLPNGLFEFKYSLFLKENSSKGKLKKGYARDTGIYPDWSFKEEKVSNYLNYGDLALNKIK